MENRAYRKQLEFYIDHCIIPGVTTLKEMGLMEWSNKKLEDLSQEELLIIVTTQKNCIFSQKVIRNLKFLIKKAKEPGLDTTPFQYTNVFIYGLMLGKAWERANKKY